MHRIALLNFILLLATPILADTDADFEAALELVRQDKNVPAIQALGKVAAQYEASGQTEKAVQVNACLYYVRKRMTLAETETVKRDPVLSRKVEAATKDAPPSEAAIWYERAEKLDAGSRDPLLVAASYFEVADRFKDTDVGRKALQRSLQALQKASVFKKAEKPDSRKPDAKKFNPLEPDYAALTGKQWDSISALTVRIVAKTPLDTKVDVLEGQQYILIPHPDDRWYCMFLPEEPHRNTITDFKGFCEKDGKVHLYGIVMWRLAKEEAKHEYSVKVEGSGRLYIQMNNVHPYMSRGEMRVKIIRAK